MNLADFSDLMRARARLLQDPALRERLALVAANAITVSVKRRVFQNGIAQDGSLIGSYSTKPAYFSTGVRGLPKISPKGKTKRAIRSFYSESGYKGFRDAVGRQSGKVDLNLTGATFSGVGVGVGRNGLPAFGVKTNDALKKIQGNEQRFDCVTITPNDDERQEAHDAVRREINYLFKID